MGGTEGLADMPPELIDLLQPKDINTTPWSCPPPFRLQPTEASDTTSSLSLLDMEPSSPNPSSSPVIPRTIDADDNEKITKEAGTGKEKEKEEIEEEAKNVTAIPSEEHQEIAEEGKEKKTEKKENRDMTTEKEKEEVHEIASTVGESKASATMELDTQTTTSSAALPMIPINEEDADESLFPSGKYDEHNQQIDLRSTNSWIYQMDQVPLIELAEVHVINSLAPYLLNSMLMPLMRKSPEVLLLPCFFPPPPPGEYLLKAIHTVGSLYY